MAYYCILGCECWQIAGFDQADTGPLATEAVSCGDGMFHLIVGAFIEYKTHSRRIGVMFYNFASVTL